MQRMRQTAVSLHETLPDDFRKALPILKKLAPRIGHSFAAITLSEFVALYGSEHFDLSLDALKFFTRFGSSEFAIRHFLHRRFRPHDRGDARLGGGRERACAPAGQRRLAAALAVVVPAQEPHRRPLSDGTDPRND